MVILSSEPRRIPPPFIMTSWWSCSICFWAVVLFHALHITNGFVFPNLLEMKNRHPRKLFVGGIHQSTGHNDGGGGNKNSSVEHQRRSTTTTPLSSSTQQPQTMTTPPTTYLIFPGGGVFFNWQGGIIEYLREQDYDLSTCTFIGSSAGSMTATFAATNVDFHDATSLAIDLASKYQVWDRPQGLQGVLHPMIEEWLNSLLPQDDDDDDGNLYSTLSNVSILVTPVPFLWQKEKVTSFANRQDLIDCNLSSIYLPFFSNGGLWQEIQSQRQQRHPFPPYYIDGNFLSTGKHYRPPNAKGSNTIVLNWQKDPILANKGEKDLVATITPDAVWDLVERGKVYAKLLEEKGKFKNIPKLQ